MKRSRNLAAPALALLISALLLACSSKDSPKAEPATKHVVLGPKGALSFLDADGNVLLSSVSQPSVAADVPYFALGFSTEAEPELVPPTFETDIVPPPVPEESARHAATSVQSTKTTPDGFVSVLATDDPAGRTMTVTVSEADGLARVTVTVSKPEGVTAVFGSFQSPSNEAFHGFGGRRESTDLRGRTIANWVHDYRERELNVAYYYPQPMFLSSAGYGLWIDTERMATFRMASDLPDAFRVCVADSTLRLVLAPQAGVAALKAITALSGRHAVAPSWSMGPTLSRTVRLFADSPGVYQAKVEDDVARIVGGAYLVEAYAYEGWARLPDAFVTQTNATLTAAGIHPVLYIRSFVSDDTAGTERKGVFDEALTNGYVATYPDGTPYVYPSSFPGNADAAVIDFTNPEAVVWWKGRIRAMLDTGADGFMSDFGEQVLPNMVFADGSTGATMHNKYPVLQHRATREAVDAYKADHPGREPFFFVRSGYAGTPGSVAYEDAAFPGDESSNFDKDTGLPSIVPDMLNRQLFGGYGFSTDIGGYADFVDGLAPTEELYVRWLEAAVFTSHFRVHNSAVTGVRMPWSFGAETEATWKEMVALHNRARPLIERLWREAQASAEPPLRPVWLNDPSSEARAHGDDEWLVGPDLLVAPVLEEQATSREVYFPGGCWQLHGDGATYEGPTTVTVEAPLRMLPWFTRCGTSL